MPDSLPIQLWEVEKLVPYEQNAKKHEPEQVDKLARAIQKFGWTQPIVVWKDGSIIAGHGRRLAALQLGLKKVPVVVRDDLTQSEADALRLADNRVSSTEYDQQLLGEELQRLIGEIEDEDLLVSMGFDQKELDFTAADLGEIDDSFFTEDVGEAVEVQKKENEGKAEEADATLAPVSDAIGFKRLTIAQSREIRSLMDTIESATGLKGEGALIEALRSKAKELTSA